MEHLNDIKYGIAAVRVSSDKQGLQGDSPESQLAQIQLLAQRKNIIISKVFEFIESASKEIQPNQKAIDYCLNRENKISCFFIKSIDRFTRGGLKFYTKLKDQLDDHNVQLLDVYGIIGEGKINTLEHLGVEYEWSKYSPTFKSEILEAERAKDEVRDILTRLIGAEIEYVRLGYAVRQPPYGFINTKIETLHGKRTILKPHSIESIHIIAMYKLRAVGNKSDKEIINIVNKMGFKTREISLHDKEDRRKIIGKRGGNPMTVKLLQRYICKPVYAGYKYDKWTRDKPIKAQFDGLVSKELFNKANHGKINIIHNGGEVKIYEGKIPSWLKRKNRNNPNFPYKQYVTCPYCHKPLFGSASRGKSGKYFPAYHCNRNHYFRIPIDKFNNTIINFVSYIKTNENNKEKIKKALVKEWKKRKKQNTEISHSIEDQIKKIDQEIRMLADKIKIISSPDLIKIYEKDIEDETKRKNKILEEPKILTLTSIDLDKLIEIGNYYMEHLQELLFSSEDKIKNAAMFGLLFDELPNYQDLVNGTPKLSPIIELNKQFDMGESSTCDPSGIRTHDYLDENQES